MPTRYTDGYISPSGATDWKWAETGPGNGRTLTPAQMTDSGATLRVRKTASSTLYAWAANPDPDLTPVYWSNFAFSTSFPIRDKDATTAATVVWAGVYPTNLRSLVVVWDGPVTILDRTKIVGAIVSSIEGRVMHLLLPAKVAIDGSTNSTVTFQPGSVGVFGLVKDLNQVMYSTPPVASTEVVLSADTLNDTTHIAALQDSATKDSYIHAFYGTQVDLPITAQCWQQFETLQVSTCASTSFVCPPWMLCYNLWGTTVPMDLFPPEQLLAIPDIGHFGAGSFTVRLTSVLSPGSSQPAVEVLGASGPPVSVAVWPAQVNYTPSPTGGAYTDSLPPGTMLTLSVCAKTEVDGNSSPVGGSTPLPWLAMLVRSGETLITTPAEVYGIKRKAGEAMAADWKFVNRRATATCTLTAGAVSTVTLTDCGIGYTSLPTVTVTAAPGGGTNAVITPTLATDGDRVEGVYITACGSGYTSANATFTTAPVGGVTAAGTVVLRDGKVVAVTVTNKGRGYLATPACTITGDGTSATATAVRGVSSITLAITTAGSGYIVAPTITISVPPVGVAPAPPSIADPAPADWDDGLGWGIINAGSLTGGITAGSAALICHDDRGMVAYGLMGDNAGGVPFSRAPDSILSWYQTLVKLSIADADADGVLPAWVPMSGGV